MCMLEWNFDTISTSRYTNLWDEMYESINMRIGDDIITLEYAKYLKWRKE